MTSAVENGLPTAGTSTGTGRAQNTMLDGINDMAGGAIACIHTSSKGFMDSDSI
jgi:hypothetical protein